MRKILFTVSLFINFISCTHHLEKKTQLTREEEKKLYETIKTVILEENAKDLQECNCMKAFYRDLNASPDDTSRYLYDRKLGEHAILVSKENQTVRLFAIGPGVLLNELTAYSMILALGKNLEIYATDWAYIFYGKENFAKTATMWAENRDLIPEGWKQFNIWGRLKPEKEHVEKLIPLLERHHRALDQFQAVIKKIAKIYDKTVTFNLIEPPKTKKITLPEFDLVTAIDSFQDVPNLMFNFFYNYSLQKSPVRFVALNKTKSLGDFWDAEKGKEREEASLQDVHIDIYDINQHQGFGSYQEIERIKTSYTKKQKERSTNYIDNPDARNEHGLFDP